MKRVIAMVLLVSAGCTYNYDPTVQVPAPRRSWITPAPFTVVNNTTYDLRLFREGNPVGLLRAGGVIQVVPDYDNRATITAVAHDGERVIGSQYHLFSFPGEAWQISYVTPIGQ